VGRLARLPDNRVLVFSSSEARRLIKQGGVYLDGKRVADENLEILVEGEKLLKVGKGKFLKIIIS
jgi:tyrosyl-tRNA synthetase